jgi:DNA end-binding protein Ku
MVSIPVGLSTVVQEKDLSFNQIHTVCGSRIKLQKFCPVCERVVENTELARGYQYAKNQYVLLDDEDFEAVPVPTKHTINVVSFVKAEEIDPVYFDSTYYLEPGAAGKKPFALLAKALEEKKVSALGKIALRNKENLCLIRLAKDTLVLETLFWPDEIRKAEDQKLEDVKVDEKELKMAMSLVELLEDDFHPENFKDEYREALLERIEAKAHGEELVEAPNAPETKVIDLMEALKASVEAAKKNKPAKEKTG